MRAPIFLFVIVLSVILDSCTIYKKQTISIEEASNYKTSKRLSVEVYTGSSYKMNWLKVEDGYVSSMVGTSRMIIHEDSILRVKTVNENINITLDSGLIYQGRLELYIKQKNSKIKIEGFTHIERNGEYIYGYNNVARKQYPITIPIENVASIRQVSAVSTGITTLTIIVLIFGTIYFIS